MPLIWVVYWGSHRFSSQLYIKKLGKSQIIKKSTQRLDVREFYWIRIDYAKYDQSYRFLLNGHKIRSLNELHCRLMSCILIEIHLTVVFWEYRFRRCFNYFQIINWYLITKMNELRVKTGQIVVQSQNRGCYSSKSL